MRSPNRLPVSCWCERSLVMVSEDLIGATTYSCGRSGCASPNGVQTLGERHLERAPVAVGARTCECGAPIQFGRGRPPKRCADCRERRCAA